MEATSMTKHETYSIKNTIETNDKLKSFAQ